MGKEKQGRKNGERKTGKEKWGRKIGKENRGKIGKENGENTEKIGK